MPDTLPNTDREGREIEVGSVIRYWRTDGWNGGWNVEGEVMEIKPKSYVVRPLTERTATVGPDERVTYVEYASVYENESGTHKVNKVREHRYGGTTSPTLVRTAAENATFKAENEAVIARVRAYNAERDAQRIAEREREQAATEKRADISKAVNAAVEALKEKYREEFERLVTVEYRQRGITPSDLDDYDTYYSRGYIRSAASVRPEGYAALPEVNA